MLLKGLNFNSIHLQTTHCHRIPQNQQKVASVKNLREFEDFTKSLLKKGIDLIRTRTADVSDSQLASVILMNDREG